MTKNLKIFKSGSDKIKAAIKLFSNGLKIFRQSLIALRIEHK